jgi:hypothetical protein
MKLQYHAHFLLSNVSEAGSASVFRKKYEVLWWLWWFQSVEFDLNHGTVKNWFVVVIEKYQVMGYRQLQRGYCSVLLVMMFTFLYARLQSSCLHTQMLWGYDQTLTVNRLMWQSWSELEPKMDTFNWINQQDAATFQVYYLLFKYSLTCFGHPYAHNLELQQLQ